MTGNIPLGAGAEFDRIRSIITSLGENARSIGDDAAVLDIQPSHKLVVSTDMSVENVHFQREWLQPEEIGYRATAAALSDIAAMAATPRGALLAISLPEADVTMLDQIARGAARAANVSGTNIIGGDLSAAPVISITVTVLGSAERPVGRNGAKAGDQLYLTGRLGGAALALAAFQRGASPVSGARERFAMPQPRIREAIWLAEQGASACVDISDGAVGDLGHIAAASAVDIIVDAEKIPLFADSSLEVALSSGEEYELCVTANAVLDTVEFERLFGIPLTRIGRIEQSRSPSVIFQRSGSGMSIPPSFSHFTR